MLRSLWIWEDEFQWNRWTVCNFIERKRCKAVEMVNAETLAEAFCGVWKGSEKQKENWMINGVKRQHRESMFP